MRVADVVSPALRNASATGAPVSDLLILQQAVAEIAAELGDVQPQVLGRPAVQRIMSTIEDLADEMGLL